MFVILRCLPRTCLPMRYVKPHTVPWWFFKALIRCKLPLTPILLLTWKRCWDTPTAQQWRFHNPLAWWIAQLTRQVQICVHACGARKLSSLPSAAMSMPDTQSHSLSCAFLWFFPDNAETQHTNATLDPGTIRQMFMGRIRVQYCFWVYVSRTYVQPQAREQHKMCGWVMPDRSARRLSAHLTLVLSRHSSACWVPAADQFSQAVLLLLHPCLYCDWTWASEAYSSLLQCQ